MNKAFVIGLIVLGFAACNPKPATTDNQPVKSRIESTYTNFALTTDLSQLEDYEREMIPHLIEAAKVMDELFWEQAYGNRSQFLSNIKDTSKIGFALANYGPWDRLDGDKPFIDGEGEKSLGANMYPSDATKLEISKANIDSFGAYSMVRRDSAGKLITIPYHVYFKEHLEKASKHLRKAAEICENVALKSYLELRAEALLTDDFTASDIAWLTMEDNGLDIIIGPIENYEDKLYNARTSYEAYVLVKDKEWSAKLKKFVNYLPELQKGLPVDSVYKQETPGSGSKSQLAAFDVIYYAGDCNAGSKTIAVNLPNDEFLQTNYGTRRSQLKNAMRAKFDKILLPISDVLIDESQRKHITFDAFFANTMFHEVAHGLGIKNTINGKGTVKQALQETHSALEEGKADILGLYMITQLRAQGAIEEGELMDNYVTFMASIFRSVRFGASSAHGKANMIRFNYFQRHGAFERDGETGTYKVNPEKMEEAMNSLSNVILTLQGNGDKAGVEELMKQMGNIEEQLQSDLDLLSSMGIPVDIIFEQGLGTLLK
jgi:hypothetical protein